MTIILKCIIILPAPFSKPIWGNKIKIAVISVMILLLNGTWGKMDK